DGLLARREDDARDAVALGLQLFDRAGQCRADHAVHGAGGLAGHVDGQGVDPLGALVERDRCHRWGAQSRSTIVALPLPPATQSVTRPRLSWRRSSSSSRVPTSMQPVAPSGWPRAMAPPFTLTFSCGTCRSLMKRSTTEAKASLTSNRSMSSTVSPALRSA